MDRTDYYLGLDMGTNSVGWAITDKNYNILRAKGKDLWGVRLFDEANTSAERRLHRVARRSRQREIARNNILRMLFADEINAKDPAFFVRLQESKYHFEDRSAGNQQKYAIFADKDFTDKEYYEKYPTIFHLRASLLHGDETSLQDVRLVYLAIANIFSRRGHFLNHGLNSEDSTGNISDLYLRFADLAQNEGIDLPSDIDAVELEKILGQSDVTRTTICKQIAELLSVSSKNKKAYAILKAISGLEPKLSDIFDEEIVSGENAVKKISFRGNYAEEELEEILGDEAFELISVAKQIHDIGLLSNLMCGHEYLSEARVESYNRHKADLVELKQLLKKYD